MPKKLAIPSILGLNTEGMSPGTVTYMQAIADGLDKLDSNVVYRDSVKVNIPDSLIRATGAQGQAFSVQGTSLASGDDYAALVRDVKLLIQSHIALVSAVKAFVEEIRGT